MGYGAIGNSSFRYYKEEIAEGITLSGQLAIRFIANRINAHLNRVCNTKDYDYICAIDTDSVIGSTRIAIKNTDMQIDSTNFAIEEFFKSAIGEIEQRGTDNLIKHVKGLGYTTKTYENGVIVEKPINYVMAHKVKKKHYKITIKDKSGNTHVVQCTADHSLSVERDGILISIKPSELTKGDVFIIDTKL